MSSSSTKQSLMTSPDKHVQDNDEEKPVILVKVAIVGDPQVGKTSLLVKYIEDRFSEEYITTMGLNVMQKSFLLKNCIASLECFDLGGGREFAGLLPHTLDTTKAVIFTFNLIAKASLVSVKRWYKDARKLNKVFKPVLVGLKYDLFEEKDESFKEDITKMARGYAENMHAPFIMCSCRDHSFIHLPQVFTIVVGSVFQIKIKSRQRHDHQAEPVLEYDILYKKKTKKKKEKKSVEPDQETNLHRLCYCGNSLKEEKKRARDTICAGCWTPIDAEQTAYNCSYDECIFARATNFSVFRECAMCFNSVQPVETNNNAGSEEKEQMESTIISIHKKCKSCLNIIS